jgi:starch phosphorylase
MEFGVHQSLPIYSGGLGVLAGDHLKSASDLGVPLIGIGLLYTYGYFSQSLSREGWQQEGYEAHSPESLAVTPVLDEAGEQLRVSVDFPDERVVVARVWRAAIGRITLLLLDTNLDENAEDFRVITDRLYGGDAEHRIKQELVLGVGGVRAVQRYCEISGLAQPDVFHMNEGHAGFLGIERIGQLMARGASFETALAAVRASTLFTTHTPVPAGIDRFDMHLAQRYLQPDADGRSRLAAGVPVKRVLELGGEDDPQRFNMAHLGLRLAQYANGVAKLHGAVSRGMFQDLYPNYDVDEVPITSITNGVHVPTWTRGPIKTIVASMAGGRDVATADRWENADAVGSAELWRIRNELRRELVERSRDAALVAWEQRGAQQAELGWTKQILNPEALTIGFARRVSTYKRLTLMLQQPERLRRIPLDPDRPVQFVIAGKAHPNDMEGKQLLQQIVQFADDAGVRDHIVFIPDYNISLGKYLVAGSDVWLNNPIRPQEASGTSGMKAVMNGCLTMSISDGWWDELASDEVGWTIPTASTGDPHQRDAWEAQALYDILEHQVVPMFYDRDAQGIPHAWVDKVRRSMSQVGPQVAAERMVRDYVRELYLPAGRTARLAADLDSCGAFADWQQRVRDGWHGVAVTDVRNESGTIVAGDVARISAQVELGALEPSDVLVEAIAGRVGADGELIAPQRRAMTRAEPGRYEVETATNETGEFGYTVRVVPHHELLRSPAELGLIRYAE